MHKNTMKCNKIQSKWCINKHGASKIIDTFETYHPTSTVRHQDFFLALLPGRKRISAREVSHFQSFNFVIVLLSFITLFCFLLVYQKYKKNYFLLQVAFMSSLVPITMSPEEMIFTFKQKSEESFNEAWSRISDSHNKTETKMTLGLLLSSFLFGLVLCYRYALDAVAGGISFVAMGIKLLIS
jgi:putative flippase GtrA